MLLLARDFRRLVEDTSEIDSTTVGRLEDLRESLALWEADREIARLGRECNEGVPDNVKSASREAFAASGLHGFAMSGMDPKEHNRVAKEKHAIASKMAKDAGLVRLHAKHQERMHQHAKQELAADSDDD